MAMNYALVTSIPTGHKMRKIRKGKALAVFYYGIMFFRLEGTSGSQEHIGQSLIQTTYKVEKMEILKTLWTTMKKIL